MSLNDPLSNVLSHILCEDKNAKKQIIVKPSSNIIKTVLKIIHENKFIGAYKEIKDGKGNKIQVNLLGAINNCCVIKPRFNVKKNQYVKFEKRFLPAYGFGFLIVSTSQGIMTQDEAIKKGLGGKLLAYVY